MNCKSIKKVLLTAAAFVAMTAVLAFNYNTNVFNNDYETFKKFSTGSEALVTSGIIAQQRGFECEYPIGYYESACGYDKGSVKGVELYNSLCAGVTDNYFEFGYSRTDPGLLALGLNALANNVYEQGKKVQFADGSEYNIESVTVEGEYFYVQTDCDSLLSQQNNGMLLDAKFFDGQGGAIVTERYGSYISHCGFQGKIFNMVANFANMPTAFVASNLLCSVLTAAVFAMMVILICKKYNAVMAVCFYGVFLLAPVVVNFARNLYWVEFTWFAPVLVGLWCAVYFENKTVRICSYLLAFITVFVKSLCGYEYISTILVAMMVFLFADFVVTLWNKDTAKSGRYFKTMCIMGVMAVLGFAAAIVIHASMRGDGNIAVGIAEIWQGDVMRRTLGGNPADYAEVFEESLNASISDVMKLYINPEAEVISRISGSWFKIIMVLPLAAFAVDFISSRKVDISEAVLYILTFAAAVSWFILAKSHSYEHTHLNIAMWYFGFVQMCFYIPVNTVIKLFKKPFTKG